MTGKTRKADVKFCRRRWIIEISSRVTKLMQLKDGDVIDVIFDGYEYVLVKLHDGDNLTGAHRCTLRALKQNGNHLRTSCKKLVINMLDAANAKNVLSVGCGEMRGMYGYGKVLPLIVRNNLAERKDG